MIRIEVIPEEEGLLLLEIDDAKLLETRRKVVDQQNKQIIDDFVVC